MCYALILPHPAGDLPVSESVRFADVVQPRPPRSRRAASSAGPVLLPSFGRGRGGSSSGGGAGLSLQVPPAGPVTTTTAAVFGGLGAWALAQGLMEPSPAAAAADVPGLQIALGCAASVYLLRETKRASLPKALGITMAGLVAGGRGPLPQCPPGQRRRLLAPRLLPPPVGDSVHGACCEGVAGVLPSCHCPPLAAPPLLQLHPHPSPPALPPLPPPHHALRALTLLQARCWAPPWSHGSG